MFRILKLLLTIAFIFCAIGFGRTLQVESSALQKSFIIGATPNTPLDGFYAGTVADLPNSFAQSWRGKKFDASNNDGINVFGDAQSQLQQYPFTTTLQTSLRDPSKTVLAIDYSNAQNPFWVHPVLDEIVEVTPGHYVGKMLLRIIPQFPFVLTFFELTK